MSYQIVDKKRFVFFAFFLLMILAGFVLLILNFKNISGFFAGKLEDMRTVSVEKRETDIERREDVKEQVEEKRETGDQAQSPEAEKKEESKEGVGVVEYENMTYGYKLFFSEKWHMNNDDSESRIVKIENEDGFDLSAGGQTFWSNYPDINKFSPSDKPDDFRLLGLTIYQDQSKTIDEFAKKIGYEDDFQRKEFEVSGLQGIELVTEGLSKENPKISIIYQKGDKFFVFRPVFIEDDEEAAGIMSQITKSFQIP